MKTHLLSSGVAMTALLFTLQARAQVPDASVDAADLQSEASLGDSALSTLDAANVDGAGGALATGGNGGSAGATAGSAGTGGSGGTATGGSNGTAGAATAGQGGATAGSDTAAPAATDDSGCSCSVPGKRTASNGTFALLGLGALAWATRGRRRTAPGK